MSTPTRTPISAVETRTAPATKITTAAIALTVALVIATLALWVWSLTERLPVSVIVTPSVVIGKVGPATVPAPRADDGPVAIGYFLQGNDPATPVFWQPVESGGSPAPDPATRLYRLGTESAWSTPRLSTMTVTQAPPSGAAASPRFGDWFDYPLGGVASSRPGLIMVTRAISGAFEVDTSLLRARNAAGIFVGDADGANGLLFYFRPENRDVMWYQIRDGQWLGPIATAQYRSFSKDPVSSVQDVARLALGGIPVALIIVGLFGMLGWATRWRRFSLSSQGEGQVEGVFNLPRSAGVPKAAGTHPRTSWLPDLAAIGLALAGLSATLYVADALLERMPHVQDSVAYLFQAKTFALARLWVPTPAHPEFFAHEFILQLSGRWFSKYPPGWPMILALGQLVNAPWIVDPICGALALVILYRLGKEIYRPRVGVLAALLGLSAPFFLFLSGSMMSHTSGLLFTLLMTWAFWRASRAENPTLPAALAGVCFGVLFLIRPFTAIPLALPFAVYALLVGVKQPLDLVRRYAATVVCALPFVAAFLAYNKVFTGDWFYPPQQLWWPFDSIGFGADHGPWGFTPIDALNNTSRNLTELLTHGFGWPPFLTLAILPIPFLIRRARTWDWLFLAGFVGLIFGYSLWWADGIMYGPRFYFEGFGFMVLLTARGIDELIHLGKTSNFAHFPALERGALGGSGEDSAQRPTRSSSKNGMAQIASNWLTPLAAIALVAGLIGYNLVYYLPGQLTLYHGYNYVSRIKLNAVQAAGIHHAVVFANVGQQYEWWEYGEVFSANDPLLQGDVIYARDLGEDQDRVLMTDFPSRTFYRLDGTTLTKLSG